MQPTTAKALLLGTLALAILAAPGASASDAGQEEVQDSDCEIVETMLFHPYVVIHPECIPPVGP